ncbi:MAG: peptidase M19, partial [Nannocystaceae bacterium]|nr:peptidase M19 [Nannocystaceae bacterium]
MLTGRSVYTNFLLIVGSLAACGDSGAATPATDTEATGSTPTSTTVSGEGTVDETGEDTETAPPAERLRGIADLHLHMFAEEAFGGGWFHGTHNGPGEAALGPCDGGDPGDHGRLRQDLAPLLGTCEGVTVEELAEMVPLVNTLVYGGGPLITEFIAVIPGSRGDTGEHADRSNGWPELDGWPRWDAIAHQQVWE